MTQTQTVTMSTLVQELFGGHVQDVQSALVPTMGREIVAWAQSTAVIRPPQVVQRPQVSAKIMTQLGIMAAQLMGAPVGRLDVLEQCGYVWLVQAWPWAVEGKKQDPVIPLTAVPVSKEYERRLQQFVKVLLRFPNTNIMGRDPQKEVQKWYADARKKCDKALEALDPTSFTESEFVYMVLELQAAAAYPWGRQQVSIGSVESAWPEGSMPDWPSRLYEAEQRRIRVDI